MLKGVGSQVRHQVVELNEFFSGGFGKSFDLGNHEGLNKIREVGEELQGLLLFLDEFQHGISIGEVNAVFLEPSQDLFEVLGQLDGFLLLLFLDVVLFAIDEAVQEEADCLLPLTAVLDQLEVGPGQVLGHLLYFGGPAFDLVLDQSLGQPLEHIEVVFPEFDVLLEEVQSHLVGIIELVDFFFYETHEVGSFLLTAD